MLEIKPILSTLLRQKSHTLLVIFQVAITLAVVVNAIFIIKQRTEAMNSKSGIPEQELITFALNTFDENADFEFNYRADENVLKALPGVVDASVMNAVPLGRGGDSSSVAQSKEEFANQNSLGVAFYRGGINMLNTLGVKLIAGRNFNLDEVSLQTGNNIPNVVIITQSLAQRLFPDKNALGQTIHFWNSDILVVGIVDYLVSPWVNHPHHEKAVLIPSVPPREFIRMMVRVEKGEVDRIMGQIEETLIKRDPNRVILQIRPMTENRELSYQNDAAMTKILMVVSLLLILITALGIIGQASFSINQRIKQIGTRRALGASKVDILRYFITENILTTLCGLSLGIVLAIGLNVYLVNTFQLSPIEWFYIPIGMLIMLITGVISVWLPAHKATLIPPSVATQNI
ncbi:ABC transporter permease [Aliikangiella sp. IMCC44632]